MAEGVRSRAAMQLAFLITFTLLWQKGASVIVQPPEPLNKSDALRFLALINTARSMVLPTAANMNYVVSSSSLALLNTVVTVKLIQTCFYLSILLTRPTPVALPNNLRW